MKHTFIESGAQLDKICDELAQNQMIGVDLEADAMHCFKEKICLIQIATEKEAYLVDPFLVDKIDPFITILEDKTITKIFHGADFDIRSLDRDYHATVANLFDTEIACRFLGIKERGLAALLRDHFDVMADKKYQKVDWSQRPLKPEMIEYSVTDVAYLTRLHEILKQKLENIGRLNWAKEEFEYQEKARYECNNDRPLFRRIKGAGRLDNRSLAVLENLLELRLTLAEKKDRPLFKVISNQALITLATERPKTLDQMTRLRALSKRQAEMYGEKCLRAIRDGLNLPHKDLPAYPKTRRPKKDKKVMDRIKHLKKHRETLSESLNMEPGILLNNAMITAIAVQNPDSSQALSQIEGLRNWQIEAVGDQIISVLNRH